jgi:hypothetical protein
MMTLKKEKSQREESQRKERIAKIMVSTKCQILVHQTKTTFFLSDTIIYNFIFVSVMFLCDQTKDDPYYCGLRARVPNFVKRGRGGQPIVDPNVAYISANNLSKMMKEKDNRRLTLSSNSAPFLGYHPSIANMNHYNPYSHRLWQAKSYESGIGN